MTRSLLTLTLASILATGCAHVALAPTPASAPKAYGTKEVSEAKEEAAEADVSAKSDAPAAEAGPVEKVLRAPERKGRAAGDFIVYRFSGSFRKAPLTLTERVIEQKGSILTLDITAEEDGQKQELRITVDDSARASNEVLSVARLVGGVEQPATLEDYEALMATTALSADENEALLTSEELTVDLGGAPVPCRQTSYRVRIGKKQATLRTLESDGFAWGDLGGEITTASGKTLYRAEVVELGHVDVAKGRAVANVAP